MIPEEGGADQAQDGDQDKACDGLKKGDACVGEEGAVCEHLAEIFYDTGGTAEKEAVNPCHPGGGFPEAEKKKQEKKPSETDSVVMSVVGAQEISLARGDRRPCLRRLFSHLSIPPIVD